MATLPPRNGTFGVLPEYGVASETTFIMNASQWVDDADSYPLQYAYYYKQSDGTVVYLSAYGNQVSNFTTRLPIGPHSNYSMTVGVRVRDQYYAFADHERTITVVPPGVAEAAAKADEEAERMSSAIDDVDEVLMSQNLKGIQFCTPFVLLG